LKEACRKLKGCAIGQAKLTEGFDLPARFVIHTVGPIWQGGGKGEPEKLNSCYENSLQLAADNGLATVAFPAISTGIYGYPKQSAAQIAVAAIRRYLARDSRIIKVYLVAYDEFTANLYHSILISPPA
ncbi:MAG: macro domain-containing protein, partial [Clostridiales bacterium]|nr:macro domain-containing protein [Clostridiales bacterium]